MTILPFIRRQGDRPARASRKIRLAVERCESRQLLSGATISGDVVRDLSGAGTFTDDVNLPGVTVDLYKSGSSAVFEHAVTNSSGNYSFTGLSAGNYTVQQALPAGYIPTGANYGYPVTASGNQTYPGKDFEDFELEPLPTITNLSFKVTTPAGKSTTVTELSGNVQQSDTVTASFKLPTAAQITLVSYEAPNNDFDTTNLQEQTIFSKASVTGSGSESLTVKVPDGYFQLDFVAGQAIANLAVNPNITYHAQDRFIQGADGGTQKDPSANSPAVLVPVTVDPASLSHTVAPTVTVLTDADVAAPGQERKH